MSVQVIAWALEDAPDVPARLVSTLIAIANYANRHGRGSFPGNDTLADHTRKSLRQVKRDLDELLELGLIREGDQQLVSHLRPDRRPRVWDLAVERKRSRGDTHDTPSPDQATPRGVTHDMSSVSTPEPRGDTHDTPSEPRGVIQGRHGVTWVSPEPKEEPKTSSGPAGGSSASPAGARARARGPAVSVVELTTTAHSVGAWSLVTPWRASHTTKYRYGTYRDISKEVDLILADNGIPELIEVALRDWDTRGKSPAFLRHCYDDAVHATRPVHIRPTTDNRPATTNMRVGDALSLAEKYEAQERAESAQAVPLELPGVAS